LVRRDLRPLLRRLLYASTVEWIAFVVAAVAFVLVLMASTDSF
jgi:hypothetical protein